MKARTLNIADLFCGAGGTSTGACLAAERAGYELDQRPLRFLECPTPQSQSKPVLDHLMTEIQTRTGCTTSN